MGPLKITRFTRAASAASDFERWYRHMLKSKDGEAHRATLQALQALGPNPHPDAVDKVFAESKVPYFPAPWTMCHCSGCKSFVDTVIRVGEPKDYESATADLCINCLSEAYALVADSR